MSAEPTGPRTLGAGLPLAPGMPARPLSPRPLAAPRAPALPENVAEPQEPVRLPAAPVDPDARLPRGFAKLSVQRAYGEPGQEAFWLTGHSGELETRLDSEYTRLRPRDLALHNLREGSALEPSEILNGLADWSEAQQPLVRWIDGLRARWGADLHLVVWDDTDYDIPWELLHLPGRPEQGVSAGILGALVTVVRWTTIREAGADPFGTPAECTGRVVGYYSERMRRDMAVFDGYDHWTHHGLLRPFLAELERPDLGAGLVYMGCHAEYGGRAHEVRIAGVSWSELNRLPMAGLRGGATLVCLNACDSGRLFDNRARGEKALRGFAELFLRKGAVGCIATSGKVGDDVAHELIKELVERLCADPELPVAQALREFRARAAARLPDPTELIGLSGPERVARQRRILWVLYSFMFLYFGHPLTRLRLRVEPAREVSV